MRSNIGATRGEKQIEKDDRTPNRVSCIDSLLLCKFVPFGGGDRKVQDRLASDQLSEFSSSSNWPHIRSAVFMRHQVQVKMTVDSAPGNQAATH